MYLSGHSDRKLNTWEVSVSWVPKSKGRRFGKTKDRLANSEGSREELCVVRAAANSFNRLAGGLRLCRARTAAIRKSAIRYFYPRAALHWIRGRTVTLVIASFLLHSFSIAY